MSKRNPIDYTVKNIDFGNYATIVLEHFTDNVITPFISKIHTNTCNSYIKYDLSKTITSVGKITTIPVIEDKISVDTDANIYFIFDDAAKLRYVGIRDGGKAVQRVSDHLTSGNVKSKYCTCLPNAIEYFVNEKKDKLYVLASTIIPDYLNKSVEKYYMEYFWGKIEAIWNKRG